MNTRKNHLGTVLTHCLLSTSLMLSWCTIALAQQPPAQKEQAQPKEEKDPNPIVIRLGNEEIRAKEVEAILEALPPQYRSYYRTVGRRQFADYVVNMKALSAEGERRKVEQQPNTRFSLEIARASILADATRREIASGIQVTPAEIEGYYKDHLKDFEKVHVRHIRIRSVSSVSFEPETSRTTAIPTDEEAQKKLEEIRKRIVAGEDFAELARLYSDDIEDAGQGGDAGWIGRGEKPPLDYALILEPGQMSEVMRGPYGFELVRAEERRTPPLDELRSRIEQVLRRTKTEQAIKQLRDALHPDINEEFFKPTAPEQTPRQPLLQTVPTSPTQ